MAHKLMLRAQALLAAAALTASAAAPFVRAQDAVQPRQEQGEEVVRINSELIQTDVTVLDKEGKFVEGLRPEQLELTVDGKTQPLSFFEAVTAGAADEETQMAVARGLPRPARPGATALPLDRGRSFIFFVDDLHIRPESLQRTRELLLRFIDERIGQNDAAVLFTASGQLGFLQQLTDEKAVLRLAVKRLNTRWVDTRETGEQNPITEAQAFAIERGDRTVIEYYIERLRRERCVGPSAARTRGAAPPRASGTMAGSCSVSALEQILRTRARAVINMSVSATRNTLNSLEKVVRASSALPGRNVIFFISEGFFADEFTSPASEEMRRLAASAARLGTVIYSVDASGLRTPTTIREAGERASFDSENALIATNASELTDYQQPLRTLANDSGGQALINTNDMIPQMGRAVTETARYYLLAWRPEGAAAHGEKLYHVDVKVKGRPDLTVRVRRVGAAAEAAQKPDAAREKKGKEKKKNEVEEGLMAALKSLYPVRVLPTSLAIGFTDTPGGDPTLTVSVEVDAQAPGLDAAAGSASLDVVGAIVDDHGKAVSEFERNLSVTRLEQTGKRRRIVYNHQLQLKPGLYQVRVAARERQRGTAGSAYQWVEVPDLAKSGFALSSLFLGDVGDGASQLSVCADRRFGRASRLGFFLYVYNPARSGAAPDVALQVQVFRDDQPVVTKPLFRLETGGAPDPARLSYGEDLSLADLPPGRYVLQVTAIDRTAKTTASQRTRFVVE